MGGLGGTSEIAIRIERTDGTATIFGMRSDVGVNGRPLIAKSRPMNWGCEWKTFYKPQIDAGFCDDPDSSTNMSVNGFAVEMQPGF
jgi:hypothetical protein